MDEDARILARRLIETASFAALAVLDPERHGPSITRIALARAADGAPMSLISTLSAHTLALRADPICALLVGEPEDRGDPLTHPRLTLHAAAQIIERDCEDHLSLRAHYLRHRPKAKLYVDFTDFHFVRFEISDALLNGGFGKAYRLGPADLRALYSSASKT